MNWKQYKFYFFIFFFFFFLFWCGGWGGVREYDFPIQTMIYLIYENYQHSLPPKFFTAAASWSQLLYYWAFTATCIWLIQKCNNCVYSPVTSHHKHHIWDVLQECSIVKNNNQKRFFVMLYFNILNFFFILYNFTICLLWILHWY
jgi:hypothetical protein